jgi:enamine deaminase RidA (YjgF/YER057c/UK114 family)
MSKRKNIFSGAPWEQKVGYCRAVKVGNTVHVSGTTAVDENGEIVGKNDPYKQACYIFEKIESALKEAGADLRDVVRTRMFVTDISRWEEVGKAHGEFFNNIFPAATLVEVKSLVDPELLVEIEAYAIIEE